MSVKKIALLGAASVAAVLGLSTSMAGGPEPCPAAVQHSGVYVGADVGYYWHKMKQIANADAETGGDFAAPLSFSHGNGGWTASGHLGYQFNNSLAAQFGYIWFQNQSFTDSATTPATNKLKMYSLYLALKGMVPLVDDFGLSMMIGGAYVNQKFTSSNNVYNNDTSTTDKDNYWSPMGSIALDYHVDDNMTVFLQYMFIAGNLDIKATEAEDSTVGVNIHRLTLGLNYLFEM